MPVLAPLRNCALLPYDHTSLVKIVKASDLLFRVVVHFFPPRLAWYVAGIVGIWAAADAHVWPKRLLRA
jgi:hypothetical protein